MKPRIAINISNCVAGGGRQIALWFVGRLLECKGALPFDITHIVNQAHLEHINVAGHDALVVRASPMRSTTARRKINDLLRTRRFDLLFSLFGPSGISHPRQISGLANAYVSSLSRENLQPVFPYTWPVHYLRYLAYGHMLARSRALIFETKGERDRFVARLSYPLDRTYVVPNSVNDVFVSETPASGAAGRPDHLRLLIVTANHPRKNNHMIPAYVGALQRAGFSDFTVAMTLTPEDAEPWLHEMPDLSRHLDFLGTLKPADLLDEYRRCHVVVHPSSFETYSAVYNEVRFIPRALLASDRPFAREICERFAHFFEPLDAEDFARAIQTVLNERSQAENAAWEARHAVLHPEQKFRQYIDIIEYELARIAAR